MKKFAYAGLLAFALALQPAVAHHEDVRLSIGTGGTGGVWYRLGGAMANLFTSDRMNDRLAYDLVKTLFERKPDLVRVARDSRYMSFENQFTGASPIPFHPGALRFFAEKGLKLK